MNNKIADIPRLLDKCIHDNYDLTLIRGVFKIASEIDRELPVAIIDQMMAFIINSPQNIKPTLIISLPEIGLLKDQNGRQIPTAADIKVNELIINLLKDPASTPDVYSSVSNIFLACIKRCITFLKTSTHDTVSLPVLYVLLPLSTTLSRLIRSSTEAFKFLGKAATILKNTLSKALESKMPVLQPFISRLEESIIELDAAVSGKSLTSAPVQEVHPVQEEVALPKVPTFALIEGVTLPTNLTMCHPAKLANLIHSKILRFEQPQLDFVEFESRWANISHLFNVPTVLPAELSIAFPRPYDELESTKLEEAKTQLANSLEKDDSAMDKKKARVTSTLLIPPNVRNLSLLKETLSTKAMERLPSPRVTLSETGHFLFKTSLKMWTPNAAGMAILENRIFNSKYSDAKAEDAVHEIYEVIEFLKENIDNNKFIEELTSIEDESFKPYSLKYFTTFTAPYESNPLIEKIMSNIVSKARQNISPQDAANFFIKLSEVFQHLSFHNLAVMLSLFEDFERADYGLYAVPLINSHLAPSLSNVFLSVLCDLVIDPYMDLTTSFLLKSIEKICEDSLNSKNIIKMRLFSIFSNINTSENLIDYHLQLLQTFGEKLSLYDPLISGLLNCGSKTYPKQFIASLTETSPELSTPLLESFRKTNLLPSQYTMALYFLASFTSSEDISLAAKISQEFCTKNGELLFKLPALFTLRDHELISTIEKLLFSCPDLVPNFVISALQKASDPIKTLNTIITANYSSQENISALMRDLFSLDMSLTDGQVVSVFHQAVYRATIPSHLKVALDTFMKKKPSTSKYIQTLIVPIMTTRELSL